MEADWVALCHALFQSTEIYEHVQRGLQKYWSKESWSESGWVRKAGEENVAEGIFISFRPRKCKCKVARGDLRRERIF